MSLPDYHYAWQKIRYGKKYSKFPELFELARDIKEIGPVVPNDALEQEVVIETAMTLLQAAVEGAKQLRYLAAALEAEKNKDPVQENLLRAYQDCVNAGIDPPTLTDVNRAFIKRFGRPSGREDRSIRKTFRMLHLLLANAKRGPRKGSRQLIRNQKR